ncbi:hypothetical protein OS175_04980 [Marinicella sp. S1101]|uniref:hypothetical protein n=1 Tax=Marinicella marina TaxID=2996016 RepID=UPI002260ACD8|nr:hypothetical protein [Marinicella marina]MCX7553221.1 hypothetical protein [Marinicella marina]MDJ1138953.1 hypothetical protein [Marinicella marina]
MKPNAQVQNQSNTAYWIMGIILFLTFSSLWPINDPFERAKQTIASAQAIEPGQLQTVSGSLTRVFMYQKVNIVLQVNDHSVKQINATLSQWPWSEYAIQSIITD